MWRGHSCLPRPDSSGRLAEVPTNFEAKALGSFGLPCKQWLIGALVAATRHVLCEALNRLTATSHTRSWPAGESGYLHPHPSRASESPRKRPWPLPDSPSAPTPSPVASALMRRLDRSVPPRDDAE